MLFDWTHSDGWSLVRCGRWSSVLLIPVFHSLLLGVLLMLASPAMAGAGVFTQQSHVPYSVAEGLPADAIVRLAFSADKTLYALSEKDDVFRFEGATWTKTENPATTTGLFEPSPLPKGLDTVGVGASSLNDIAAREDEIAVAANEGLYLGDGNTWELALPADGETRWAPMHVRAVVYDDRGLLWFAAPQGVGCRHGNSDWKLFTGKEGLPFNDFTCMAAGKTGVWFGTTNGAIQFHEGRWHFRQGRRWLLDNRVNDIAIDGDGHAWIATNKGVSCIRHESTTLAAKADFYLSEIEKYHRRTEFGYVNPAVLAVPGDKSTAKPTFSDNDGFNTGLYLGAMSFAYAATGDEKFRQFAHRSFRALSFLSEVTQGGEYGGPKGLIARNVVPVTEPDPGLIYNRAYDLERNKRDKLWRIMERRVPIDKTGAWYWKADASSDELDGHFFGSAIYFDLVCASDPEREAVRDVVRRLIDHLVGHDYNLVDYDGAPTRWGRFSPDDLNRNPAWHGERALNCYSILTYLAIAHHLLGDAKYRREYLKLAFDHAYAMNGMTQPKDVSGPNDPGHQPDDNMAFMNYYHLIRYETDPTLLSMYQHALRAHWQYERFDRNPFENFVYAACARGKTRSDQWGTIDLSPPPECYEDAIDTLRRYPLDLIDWPMSNAHRIDMIPLAHEDGPPQMGSDINGYAFPIDERQEIYWDWNYWRLTYTGDGTTLRPGFHYLLAYYMGRYHGFITD